MTNITAKYLSKKLSLHPARTLESTMKAKLISAVLHTCERKGITHSELAERSGIPRSAVTGILSGSLQKVTLNRVLRLVEGVGLTAEIKVKEAA